MKNLALFFLIFVTSCTHVPSRTTATAPPIMGDQDIARIRELYRVWKFTGEKAWPGFNNEKFDLSFILISKNLQWAVNVNPLPNYYTLVEIPDGLKGYLKSLAVTESYRNEFGEKLILPVEMHRSLPAEYTKFHFKHSVYFVTTIEGFKTEGQTVTADDWVHISLHELFHNYQDQFVNYSPELSKVITISMAEELIKDRKHNDYLVSELQFLAKAACGKNKTEILNNVGRAFQIRSYRWDYVDRNFGFSLATWERYQTWAEGSAHYVEHKIMLMWPLYANNSELKSDPYFKNYEAYKSESQEKWCYEIAGYSHRYWYDLGFAYALILDKLDLPWKTRSPRQPLFFDGYFRSLGINIQNTR